MVRSMVDRTFPGILPCLGPKFLASPHQPKDHGEAPVPIAYGGKGFHPSAACQGTSTSYNRVLALLNAHSVNC